MTHPTITTSKGSFVFVDEFCPDCNGCGYVVDYVTGCCNNPDIYGNCCNRPMPVPAQVQCERCCGSGYELPIAASGSTYTPLFTTKNATEEDAKGVVDWEINPMDDHIEGYLDYKRGEPWYTKDTALESLHSLLIANGLDVSKNYLIIKIEK